jgi:DNA-binding NarL/FixJ family response regulator
VTAHREPELVDAAFAAGAVGYVTKTCLAQDLLPAVRAALTGVPYVSALEAPRQ